MKTGYLSSDYARAFNEFGTPLRLLHSGGWLLERRIPGTEISDAMGCYPLFCCSDWHRLHLDLQELAGRLVSVALVADPFGEYSEAGLRRCFDRVAPFKQHFIVDLDRPIETTVTKYSRKNARKALKVLNVEQCDLPVQHADEWVALYDSLIERHQIKGMRAFSRKSFLSQLTVPGMVMFRALHEGETVGAHLWYVQGRVAYSHLSAYSLAGYELRAAYALQWYAIDFFAGKVRWLNQGSGIKKDASDGLSAFKKSWSNETRTAYFCGRILDQEAYDALVAATPHSHSDYFPPYRNGEFSN